MALTEEQRRAFFAQKTGFIKQGDLKKSVKQHNEVTKLILDSQEKERFYESKIRIEREHQQELLRIRSKV